MGTMAVNPTLRKICAQNMDTMALMIIAAPAVVADLSQIRTHMHGEATGQEIVRSDLIKFEQRASAKQLLDFFPKATLVQVGGHTLIVRFHQDVGCT